MTFHSGATRFVAVLAIAAGCAACSSGGSGSSSGSGSAQPSPGPTSTVSLPPATGPCADLVTAGSALVGALGQYADNTATQNDVKASADSLRTAIGTVQQNVAASLRAPLSDLSAAVTDLEAALTANPVDETAVRSAGEKALTALGALARPCVEASPSS